MTKLRGEVAAEIGLDPFTEAGPWQLRAAVTRGKTGAFVVTADLLDSDGATAVSMGEMVSPDCRSVVLKAMAVWIAWQLTDPPIPPPSLPAAPSLTSPSLPAPPAPTAPPQPTFRLRVGAATGIELELGVGPTPTPLFSLNFALHSTTVPLLSLAFEARTDLPLPATVEGGARVHALVVSGSLMLSTHAPAGAAPVVAVPRFPPTLVSMKAQSAPLAHPDLIGSEDTDDEAAPPRLGPEDMSRPRSEDPEPPAEPDTESRRALVQWPGSLPASRLAFLSRASGVVEPRSWAFVDRQARPAPDGEDAKLLAIATRGAVPSLGWWTDAELEACRGARAHAAHMARALDAAPQTPRSRVPASRPVAARRRRPRSARTPRSARPVSSRRVPSAAHTRESLRDPARLTLLLEGHEPPPSTERSDPPTRPSTPIVPFPRQTAAGSPSVEIVASTSEGMRRDDGRRRKAGSPPSSTRTTMGVADAIATLMQQGYSIRREKKD